MQRFVIAIALAFTFMTAVRADEGADEGRKYLKKLGAAWAQKLPEPRVMGIYVGRKWAGKATFTVKATTEGGAAFDFTADTAFDLMGSAMSEHSHILLSRDLTVVAADTEGKARSGTGTKKLTVKDGRWTLQIEKGGLKQEKSGEMTSTTVWDGGTLLAFAMPEAKETTLVCANGDVGTETFARRDAKERLTLGGKEAEYTVLEVTNEDHSTRWYLDDAGNGVYMRFIGKPLCARPCPAANVGKDIDEPLEVSEPVQRVIDLYMAMKKGDADGFLATWDLPAVADETGETAEGVEAGLKQKMLTPEAQQQLPDEAMLPDYFATLGTATQNGDEAEVDFGRALFNLHKVNDASGKPRWLIYSADTR